MIAWMRGKVTLACNGMGEREDNLACSGMDEKKAKPAYDGVDRRKVSQHVTM